MTKLKHINEFIINPDAIAYMKHWTAGDGSSLGTLIYFVAYAACASPMGDAAWEMPFIEIQGKTPVEIMDFLNDEPGF